MQAKRTLVPAEENHLSSYTADSARGFSSTGGPRSTRWSRPEKEIFTFAQAFWSIASFLSVLITPQPTTKAKRMTKGS